MKSEVFNRDCLEAMREMPDKAFDLAIVDPPYGIGVGQMNMGSRQTVLPDATKIWDNEIPTADYFTELMRISRNQIIWGGNYFPLPPSRGFAIWDKGASMYGRSFAECEFAWTSFDVSARISKINPNQPERFHPTQKPVALYKWLLTNYAKPGQSILDTHLGSGSSRIAAYDLGFDFTGYELDKDYFEAQEARFANHIAQPKLFVPETLAEQPILI
jgi:site-specific DNA-methyltransferase (adenine-specific)